MSEYRLADARSASTPSGNSELLEPVSAKDKLADADRYQRIVRQLMYLIRGIRPDICFVILRLSRYVAKPAEKY